MKFLSRSGYAEHQAQTLLYVTLETAEIHLANLCPLSLLFPTAVILTLLLLVSAPTPCSAPSSHSLWQPCLPPPATSRFS